MNKMIKGSIAGATGVALLMGGYGTYALWSDSEPLAASQISSGNMTVASNTAAWDDAAAGAWNIAADLMVPGDVVERTQRFTFTGAGKNLTGAIFFDMGTQTEPSFTGQDLSTDAFTVTVDLDGTIVNGSESSGCWNFAVSDLAGAGEVVNTTVTYALKATATNLQNVQAQIAASGFRIVQGATCPTP